MATRNTNLNQTNLRYITLAHPNETSEIAYRFQQMLGDFDVMFESDTNLFPHEAMPYDEPWTLAEYASLLESNRDYHNRTPHAGSFFGQAPPTTFPRPPTFSYDFWSINPNHTAPYYLLSGTQNSMVGPYVSNPMPMIPNQAPIIIPLQHVPYLLVPPYTEPNSTTNTIVHEPQNHMTAATASTSINAAATASTSINAAATASTSINAAADANEEIDLELRLGRRW